MLKGKKEMMRHGCRQISLPLGRLSGYFFVCAYVHPSIYINCCCSPRSGRKWQVSHLVMTADTQAKEEGKTQTCKVRLREEDAFLATLIYTSFSSTHQLIIKQSPIGVVDRTTLKLTYFLVPFRAPICISSHLVNSLPSLDL